MRRLNRRERLQEQVKQLDVFPKVEPDMDIQTTSISGAVVTIIVGLAIVGLIFTELMYYRTVDVVYEYAVDTDLDPHMNLTVDMTIAMPCENFGVDYIDVSGRSTDALQFMAVEPAHFKLSPNQQEWLDQWAEVKAQEGSKGLDSLHRFLYGSKREPMPTAAPEIDAEPDGCRVHGTMPVARVSSNFHFSAGKSVHHASGHAHVPIDPNQKTINFSHRIDRFSFSSEQRGAMALDGDMKVSDSNKQLFQYFLKVVPTTTKRMDEAEPFRSNQYSVTEQHHILAANERKLPGIHFKYEIEPIGVLVHEQAVLDKRQRQLVPSVVATLRGFLLQEPRKLPAFVSRSNQEQLVDYLEHGQTLIATCWVDTTDDVFGQLRRWLVSKASAFLLATNKDGMNVLTLLAQHGRLERVQLVLELNPELIATLLLPPRAKARTAKVATKASPRANPRANAASSQEAGPRSRLRPQRSTPTLALAPQAGRSTSRPSSRGQKPSRAAAPSSRGPVPTPIEAALEAGHHDVALLLLQAARSHVQPADLTRLLVPPRLDGLSLLHLAARQGATDVCQLLLQAHTPDLNDTCNRTPSPFALARRHQHEATSRLLAGHVLLPVLAAFAARRILDRREAAAAKIQRWFSAVRHVRAARAQLERLRAFQAELTTQLRLLDQGSLEVSDQLDVLMKQATELQMTYLVSRLTSGAMALTESQLHATLSKLDTALQATDDLATKLPAEAPAWFALLFGREPRRVLQALLPRLAQQPNFLSALFLLATTELNTPAVHKLALHETSAAQILCAMQPAQLCVCLSDCRIMTARARLTLEDLITAKIKALKPAGDGDNEQLASSLPHATIIWLREVVAASPVRKHVYKCLLWGCFERMGLAGLQLLMDADIPLVELDDNCLDQVLRHLGPNVERHEQLVCFVQMACQHYAMTNRFKECTIMARLMRVWATEKRPVRRWINEDPALAAKLARMYLRNHFPLSAIELATIVQHFADQWDLVQACLRISFGGQPQTSWEVVCAQANGLICDEYALVVVQAAAHWLPHVYDQTLPEADADTRAAQRVLQTTLEAWIKQQCLKQGIVSLFKMCTPTEGEVLTLNSHLRREVGLLAGLPMPEALPMNLADRSAFSALKILCMFAVSNDIDLLKQLQDAPVDYYSITVLLQLKYAAPDEFARLYRAGVGSHLLTYLREHQPVWGAEGFPYASVVLLVSGDSAFEEELRMEMLLTLAPRREGLRALREFNTLFTCLRPGDISCRICEEQIAFASLVGMGRQTSGGEHYSKAVCRHRCCKDCRFRHAKACVEGGQTTVRCPFPDCTYVFYPDDVRGILRRDCIILGRYTKLLKTQHEAQLKAMRHDFHADYEALVQHCRFCPSCRVPIERSDGCDAMRCICGTTFTWSSIAPRS
ncbi:uncharacterized protein MONBRDRAFT_32503 [Monosiga brevicollis MX1]|uniref:Endoplasmic reticulum-Golgi intermediate compartment protein 3 n=1 Tax=Monosiga brevicollis TaxID=81824 RepID=A9UZX6_MONBE|nr:uncharacterized protein MONBRDRAFT_32503 [Monosiga brevicollis MX1]EDQ89053.1 predicted protein [Monosiga brevicollis MX1]|eukprot:XP_001746158.1 hypothetical protein [Monosiga brevicollis MX1]